MLKGVCRAAVLKSLPYEVLSVVADLHLIVLVHIPIALGQIGILVQAAGPIPGARCEVGDCGALEGIWGGDDWNVQADGVQLSVALTVIIEEEKCSVLDDGSADITAKLMEVIGRLGGR